MAFYASKTYPIKSLRRKKLLRCESYAVRVRTARASFDALGELGRKKFYRIDPRCRGLLNEQSLTRT